MGDKSKIEWTDASWTPIRARNKATGNIGWHCEHVSPGCENCYSEKMNVGRFGTGLPFKPGHRKDIDIFLDEKMLLAPLRWKKSRMIFVCSMTDLFAEFVPDEWIDKVFAVMALCPQHTFQILTKRSKRMREWMIPARATSVGMEGLEITFNDHARNPKSKVGEGVTLTGDIAHLKIWPLPNVHLGVSCEDQIRADERIPDLLATPAAKLFVSAEPLLGAISFDKYLHDSDCDHQLDEPGFYHLCTCREPREVTLDQIIVGGESGSGHRPMQIEWAEDIMRECVAAGTAFFFKQDSGPRSGMRGRASDELWACKEFPK